MIIDAIIGIFASIVGGILDGLSALLPGPPSWAGSAFASAAEVYGYVDSMSYWVPVGLALSLGAAIGVAYLFMVTAGVVRMVLSYLTFGGGAT
jgi:hypothetical protein